MELRELIEILNQRTKFLLMSHSDPDADATGSEYALMYLLKKLKKEVIILNADKSSAKFVFFDEEGWVKSLEEKVPPPKKLEEWTGIILDTSDLDHIGSTKQAIIPYLNDFFIIDHHTPAPGISPDKAYVVEKASATCEMIYDIALELGISFSLSAAYAIFTGIVYDSGSFIYPKTSAHTFEVAKALVELGVIPQKVHSNLFEQIEPSRMRLMGKVQASLEIIENDQIAIQVLTKKMIEETKASFDEAENFINYPLKCHTVKISIMFKETGPSEIKCSLRSKGNINISNFAITMGGGGHRNAAGFTSRKTLEQVRKIVLDECKTLIQ